MDIHESDVNFTYYRCILNSYFSYEVYAHRWIQLPLEEVNIFEAYCNIIVKNGYQYTVINSTGETPLFDYEHHVDNTFAFEVFIFTTKFGDNISVIKCPNTESLFIFGQD